VVDLPDNAGPVRVGIFGPPDVVHRMIDVGHAMVAGGSVPMSLSGTTYQRLAQLPARVRGAADDLDVLLFAGPLPYDIAKEAGVLNRPATFVELSGSSLYGAMLRVMNDGEIDLERVSIDSLGDSAIAEAYTECGLDPRQVGARPYDGPDSASGFADFHRRLFERGRSSGALTTVDHVAHELAEAKVPVVRIRATASALRMSLRTAAFLGTGSVLEGAQIVIGVIELPELPKATPPGSGSPWAMQELRLEVVRALRADTDRLAISLLPRDDRNLTLVATLASIVDATHEFTVAPFVDRLRRATGITPRIGLGMGATAATAETNAELALADARGSSADRVYVRLRDGSSMSMGLGPDSGDTGPELIGSKHAETLQTLRAGLAGGAADSRVVDAEGAARLLGISARTARRVLQELARDGLAWPVPPAATTTPGRPRQTYRLVDSPS
jgi:hypothetical protein